MTFLTFLSTFLLFKFSNKFHWHCIQWIEWKVLCYVVNTMMMQMNRHMTIVIVEVVVVVVVVIVLGIIM